MEGLMESDFSFVNEPHPGGGAAVASSKDGIMFNDILGTTLGTEGAEGYAPVEMTAFGDTGSARPGAADVLFTGKPDVEGLGYAFLFRNYRAGLGKWQTADPLGYPDGWNQMTYCGNAIIKDLDAWGTETVDIGSVNVMGCHIDDVWAICNHKFNRPSFKIKLGKKDNVVYEISKSMVIEGLTHTYTFNSSINQDNTHVSIIPVDPWNKRADYEVEVKTIITDKWTEEIVDENNNVIKVTRQITTVVTSNFNGSHYIPE